MARSKKLGPVYLQHQHLAILKPPPEEEEEREERRGENNFKTDSSSTKFRENNANSNSPTSPTQPTLKKPTLKKPTLKNPPQVPDVIVDEAKLFERIKELGGYAATARTAMAERVNLETNAVYAVGRITR